MSKHTWNYSTLGIPDEMFERADKVPITKEEVRTIQISKARLSTGDTVFDVGCGSGSVGIEAALQIGDIGKVYCIDHDPNAIQLTKKNLEHFGVNNCTVLHAKAEDEIPNLPNANAIIIGGTGGSTGKIIKLCEKKLVENGRIVIATILIETLFEVLSIIDKSGFTNIDITQITISKSKKTTTGTMMLARNPVTVISATYTKEST